MRNPIDLLMARVVPKCCVLVSALILLLKRTVSPFCYVIDTTGKILSTKQLPTGQDGLIGGCWAGLAKRRTETERRKRWKNTTRSDRMSGRKWGGRQSHEKSPTAWLCKCTLAGPIEGGLYSSRHVSAGSLLCARAIERKRHPLEENQLFLRLTLCESCHRAAMGSARLAWGTWGWTIYLFPLKPLKNQITGGLGQKAQIGVI